MKKSLQKFLNKMLSDKYPIYRGVIISEYEEMNIDQSPEKNCYHFNIYLSDTNGNDDLIELFDTRNKIQNDVRELIKYMGARMCGLFSKFVSEEQWEKLKSKNPELS